MKINVFEQKIFYFFNYFFKSFSYRKRNDDDYIYFQIFFHFIDLCLIDIDEFLYLKNETIEINLISYFVLNDREKHRRHDERRRRQNVTYKKQSSKHELNEIY